MTLSAIRSVCPALVNGIALRVLSAHERHHLVVPGVSMAPFLKHDTGNP